MTLGHKTIALFLILGLGFSAGTYSALKQAVFPTFLEFEREASGAAVERVNQMLDANFRALEVFNVEYAYWDHTYEFVKGRRPEFAQENLDPEYWRSIDIDLYLLVDASGQVLYSGLSSPDGQALTLAADEANGLLAVAAALVDGQSTTDSARGLVQLGAEQMQVVAFPILKSDQRGPITGSLITGQFLDAERLQQLGKRATAEVSVHPLGGSGQEALADVMAALAASPDGRHLLQTDSSMLEYRVLHDLQGAPAAALEVKTDRRISGIGVSTVRTAALSLALACAVFLLAAWLFIRRLIVAPVKKLTETIVTMQHTGDLSAVKGTHRSDEIGILAGEFRELTARLNSAREESDAARLESEKARDEAVALSRTKSEFLARMSHEIRTPMNGVLGMTELLQGTRLDTRQQRFATTIYESAESLLGIINDILDFSKIEAGKLQLDPIEVELQALLDETVDSLASMAQQKGLELINIAPAGINTTVLTDPGRLRQVLTNLLSNAIKFTEHGEVILRTTADENADDTLAIRIEVEDTGIGISAEKQQLIFESFAQEDGSTTRLYGGTGLGLAISKQIVELMGGSIRLDSVPGKGSTFCVSLQMRKGSHVKAMPATAPRDIAGNRILIVDDNATNREILENQLSGWRAGTESASSARAAYAMLERAAARGEPHDLAILDMHMPGKDGMDLARQIRSNAHFDALTLVILSSVANPASEHELETLNIAGQLAKPVRQSQLYDALSAALAGDEINNSHAPSRAASARSLSGRVLLAEDNSVNQLVALGMLESFGLQITVAENGREAFEHASTSRYDVILMDCQMPGTDGFEATKMIRAHEKQGSLSATPIIAVTANALNGDRERCLAAGMDDYLTKPFTAEQLHSILSPILRQMANADSGHPNGKAAVVTTLASATDADPSIDRSVLDALSQMQRPDRPCIVQKVVSAYLSSAEVLAVEVRAAIEAEDATSLRDAAHALKSSSGNVGASCLAALCKQLEMMARANSLAGAGALGEQFEREYARAIAVLRQELAPADQRDAAQRA